MSNKSITEILSSIEDVIANMQAKTGFAGPVGWKSKDNVEKKSTKKTVKKPVPAQKMPRSPEVVGNGTSFKDDNGTVYKFNKKLRSWISSDKKLTLDIAAGYKKLVKAKNVRIMSEEIIKEGGNVFKNPEGPLTQRIATGDVDSTVAFLEKITGYDWQSEKDDDERPAAYLGTTGRKSNPDGTFEKNSSGDLDLNTDLNKVSKQDIIAKLSVWLKSQGVDEADIMKKPDGWIRDAGDQVHFRTPINGSDKNGFVQTDFMFTTNPKFQQGSKRGGTEQYSGKDRMMVLASVARGRNLKFSPKFGVVDPNNGDAVVADDWNEIAKILLGTTATEKDTRTVESIIAYIKKLPEYEDLVKAARDSLAKDNKTLPESTVESLADKQLRRIKELLK